MIVFIAALPAAGLLNLVGSDLARMVDAIMTLIS